MSYFKVLKKEGNQLTFEYGSEFSREITPEKLYNYLLDSLQLILFPNEITGLVYSPEITPEMQEKAKGTPFEKSFKEYGEYEFVAGQIPSATGDEIYLNTYVPKAITEFEMLSKEEQDGSETFGEYDDPVEWKSTYKATFSSSDWIDFLPENFIKEVF